MSEQKSRRQRRVFSASFKADAVKVVRAQERPIKEIAKDLTIDEGLLRRWLRQADTDAAGAVSGSLTTTEREELSTLRAQVKRLTTEREILKKAAATAALECTAICAPRAYGSRGEQSQSSCVGKVFARENAGHSRPQPTPNTWTRLPRTCSIATSPWSGQTWRGWVTSRQSQPPKAGFSLPS